MTAPTDTAPVIVAAEGIRGYGTRIRPYAAIGAFTLVGLRSYAMSDDRSDTTTMRIVPEVRDEINRRRAADQTQSGYIRWAMAEIDRLNSELDRRATVEELLDQFGDRINERNRAAAEERAAILDKLDDLER